MRTKKTALVITLCTGMAMLSVTGCSSAGSVGTITAVAETKTEQPPENHGVIAKVVSLDGDSLTVMLTQMGGRGGAFGDKNSESRPTLAEGETLPERPTLAEGETRPERSTLAEGKTRSERPTLAEGETRPEKPTLAEGETLPEKTKGEKGDGKTMEFNGETVTFTLTDNTTITKGMGAESAAVSDLTADTIVSIVLDGETVVNIRIHSIEDRVE